MLTPKSCSIDKLWEQIKSKENLFELLKLESDNEILVGKNPEYIIDKYPILGKKLRYLDKQVLYSIIASFECVKSSKMDIVLSNEEMLNHVGIVMGSMFAQLEFGLKQVAKIVNQNSIKISPFTGLAFYYGSNVGEISCNLKTRGENCAVTSGSNIVMDGIDIAKSMLENNRNKIVFVGAGESIVYDIFYFALKSKNRVTNTSYLPYDINRNGAALSNGAGMFTMEYETTALNRAAPIFAEIASIQSINASSCIFELNEQISDYTSQVIEKSLEEAGISSDEVDLVIPTADASDKGDYYEMNGLIKVFGNRTNLVYSPKLIVGYCMSFNVAVDIFTATMCMRDSIIPGHPTKIDSGNEIFNKMLVGVENVDKEVNNVLILHRSWLDGKISATVLKKYKRV